MERERVYILTGAAGHLGRTIAGQLADAGQTVRGLALPGEDASFLQAKGAAVLRGDVCDPATLEPLFEGLGDKEIVVIHAAAIIDISSKVSPVAQAVNVGGTQNIVALALEHQVYRFIHISSVHAIPEAPMRRQIGETKAFDPARVAGGYAKTKAEASRFVMESIEKRGLPGIILHPSGIMGPWDTGSNNVVQAVRSYLAGKLPACPKGGYDLVDVRDVASAVIAAVDKGRVGETYILSGRHYAFRDIFAMVRGMTGKGRPCPSVPIWLARLAAPVLEKYALLRHKKPLVTPYSLTALSSNDNFTHEKASRELGFWPRDFYETLRDTVAWLTKPPEQKVPLGTALPC